MKKLLIILLLAVPCILHAQTDTTNYVRLAGRDLQLGSVNLTWAVALPVVGTGVMAAGTVMDPDAPQVWVAVGSLIAVAGVINYVVGIRRIYKAGRHLEMASRGIGFKVNF